MYARLLAPGALDVLATDCRFWRVSRDTGIVAAVGAVYCIAAWLSFGLRIPPENVICWPAAGISSGLLISFWTFSRWPVTIGVLIANVVVNLLQHFSVQATAVWAIGNTAEPLIVAALVHQQFGDKFNLDRFYPVLVLFGAALFATAITASWWTVAYYWIFATLKEPAVAWQHWVISDLAGIASVAPLAIGIATARRPPNRDEIFEGVAALVAVGVMTGVIILLPAGPWETVVPAALLFPVLLWLAARSRPVFAAAGAFVICITVAWSAIYGFGHFGYKELSTGARVLQSQAVILVVALGACVLAALFAERRQSEAKLARSNMLLERERENKLMSLEAVAASINHELRQPLGAITASCDAALLWLAKDAPELTKARASLERIAFDGYRASEIIGGVRALFQKSDQTHWPVDINEIIVGLLETLRGELLSNAIVVNCDLAPEIPSVQGNSNQLRQVIFNLIHNAIEAMQVTKDRERLLNVMTTVSDSEEILVDVEDFGPGIDQAKANDIFEAFVTTSLTERDWGLPFAR